MGSRIHQLFPKSVYHLQHIDDLKEKTIVFDGSNFLCRYLSAITKDDTPIVGASGNPISHLIGFSYFVVNSYLYKIRSVFVFDGTENVLKHPLFEKRLEYTLKWMNTPSILKKNKYVLYKRALLESYEYLKLTGLPVISAPSDGESQGSWLVKTYDFFALSTNDYDGLLFGSPRILVGFNFSKKPIYLLQLNEILDTLSISQRQLVEIAILSGTDYNEGLKNIGPKRAYMLIQKYESLEALLEKKIVSEERYKTLNVVREYFLSPPVTDVKLYFSAPNYYSIQQFLISHGLSKKRVYTIISKLKNGYSKFNSKMETLESYL